MQTETIRLPAQRIDAAFARGEADKDARTIPVTWYSGATVLQFNFQNGLHNLKLSTDPKHVRLSKLNTGRAPFTKGHRSANDPDGVIGVIEKSSATMDGGKGRAVVRFAKGDSDADRVWNKIEQGILPNVSLEAAVYKLKDITPDGDAIKTFLSTDWEPYALASVASGADPNAHFAATETECLIEFSNSERALINAREREEQHMEQQINQGSDSVERAVELAHIGKACGLDAAFTLQHIEAGTSTEAFRKLAIDKRATESSAAGEIRHIYMVRDGRADAVEFMAEALSQPWTGKELSEGSRQYAGARLTDLARHIVVASGQRAPYSAAETIRLAHSTSDYPILLQETGNRVMLAGYEASQSQLKQVARIGSVPDFRSKTVIDASEYPSLELVPEGGEITSGTRYVGYESYRAYTYGRMISFTRQAMINDDVGAFQDAFAGFGRAAAALEGRLLFGLLSANSGTGATMRDNTAIFTEAHGNLITPGTAIDVTNLGIARRMLRLQKDLDGSTLLSISPRFLVTSATKETLADQVLSTIAAATVDDANPFSNKLTHIVVPELDASYANQWYVFSSEPVLEMSYLDGARGPQIESRQGWTTLGIELRAYMDLGVGVVNHRGAVMNLGA